MKRIIILMFSAIFAMTLITGCESKSQEAATEKQEEKEEVKFLDFSKEPLNKENATEVLKKVLGEDTNLEVSINNGDVKIVILRELQGEKQFVTYSSLNFISACKELFKNKDVKNVQFIVNSNIVNKEGTKEQIQAIEYKLSKAKYNEIDWASIEEDLANNPKAVYDVIDSAMIDETILSKLK